MDNYLLSDMCRMLKIFLSLTRKVTRASKSYIPSPYRWIGDFNVKPTVVLSNNHIII